ncbi:hypothetical protein ES705_12774 [subsurface metagenome]
MRLRLNFITSVFTTPIAHKPKQKNLKFMWRLAVFAIAFAMGALPALAQSTPIAEDSFDYPAGNLGGQGSATDPGWLGVWSGDVSVLSGGSLAYIDSGGKRLVTAGNRVRASGFSFRELETPLENSTYSEVWISFVIDDFDYGIQWAGISLYNGGQELLFMGKLGSSENLGVHEYEWPNSQRFPTSETLSGPVFFVVRLRFNESSTEWTYWLNPNLDETPKDSKAVATHSHHFMSRVTRIRIAGEVPVEFDELRIGTDYSSVAPYLKPALPAEDSFDYQDGPLGGQGSSADHGWLGPWDGNVHVLDIGSLSYTDTGGKQLITAGNRVEAASTSYRYLETPLVYSLVSEVWISFLIDNFNVGIRWAGISLYNNYQELLFMGKIGSSYFLGVHDWINYRRYPTSQQLSGPVFFVVRLRFLESSTGWTYWLNPDLDEAPQDDEAVASQTHNIMISANRIRIAGEASVHFDELRIGTDYSSVAPRINRAPFAHPGSDQTVYADDTCQAQVTLDGSGSSDPDGDALTYTWEDSFDPVDGVNPTVTLGLGTHDITLTVNDGELSDTDTVRIFVKDNIPPTPEVDPLPIIRGECSAEVPPSPTAIDNCSVQITGTSIDPLIYTEQGSYVVTWTYDDGNGNKTTQLQTVVVEDITPPSIDSISAAPNVIWPPNHKMVPVTISVSVSDDCDMNPSSQIISVSTNEPENGLGDGDTAPDWEITGDLTANLRAERSGNGSGRVYTITVGCTDSAGNSSDRQVTVIVPHDKKKK